MINWEFCVFYLTMHFRMCKEVGAALSNTQVGLHTVFVRRKRPNASYSWFDDAAVHKLCGARPDRVLYYEVYKYVRDHIEEFIDADAPEA